VCDLETSRIGTPYIYDISNVRVKVAVVVVVAVVVAAAVVVVAVVVVNFMTIFHVKYRSTLN
jgi:hypothetical protein